MKTSRLVKTASTISIVRSCLLLAAMVAASRCTPAQISALPSAAVNGEQGSDRAKKLLDQMVAALGGDAWLNRSTYVLYGQTSHFYKGTPDPYVVGFEEYYREHPFAERVVSIAHFSTIPGMPGRDHRDVAAVWTEDNGYEVSYKGKSPLPKEEVAEFQRLRKHSLDAVVLDWLRQPGVIVGYDGTGTVERRLSDNLTITTASNDSVALKLDEATHLPLSLSFKERNDLYQDFDSERIEYENYHAFQGLMTAMTVTRYKNGELSSQRFLTKADYTFKAPTDFYNPDLQVTPKKK